MAPPQTVQVEGDNRVGGIFHDQLEPFLELSELSVVADAPFRKERHHFPVVEPFSDLLDGPFPRYTGNRNDVEPFQKPFEIPLFVDPFFHNELDGPWRCDLQNQPVDPADMVAEQQYTAGLRQIFEPFDEDAVACMEDRQKHQASDELRHFQHRIDRTCQRDPCGDMEDAVRGEADLDQCDRGDQEEYHRDILDKIVARENGSHLVVGRKVLDGGVEGDDNESAEEAEGEAGGRHDGGAAGRRERCQRQEHAECTDRDDPKLDMASAQAPGHDGADDEPDRTDGQDTLDDDRVFITCNCLVVGRKGCHDELGDTPEEAESDNADPDDSVTP